MKVKTQGRVESSSELFRERPHSAPLGLRATTGAPAGCKATREAKRSPSGPRLPRDSWGLQMPSLRLQTHNLSCFQPPLAKTCPGQNY